jgi:hypothetical protein
MPFEKGKSGNPGGRPKKDTSLSGMLRKEIAKKDADGVTKKGRIVGKLIELAESGDVVALKYLFDRVDGKPAQVLSAAVTGDVSVETRSAAEKLEKLLLDGGEG